jgi:hypothetical protein
MSQTIIPRAAIRGTASGVIFMAFFGTLWAGIGIRGLQGWGFLWLLILSLLIGVILLIGGIVLIMKSKRLSNEMGEGDFHRWKRKNRWFGIIFGLEGVLIAAEAAICGSTNHVDLGTANIDTRSFYLNDESNCFIYEGPILADIKERLEEDFRHSKRLTESHFKKMNLWDLFLEQASSVISYYL